MLHDVHPQGVVMTSGECLQVIQGAVCAFILAIGVTVRDEMCVKDGFNDVAQRMMRHPITKGRSTDFAVFGFMDEKMTICTWCIDTLL